MGGAEEKNVVVLEASCALEGSCAMRNNTQMKKSRAWNWV
jgi:hypothetical protein